MRAVAGALGLSVSGRRRPGTARQLHYLLVCLVGSFFLSPCCPVIELILDLAGS